MIDVQKRTAGAPPPRLPQQPTTVRARLGELLGLTWLIALTIGSGACNSGTTLASDAGGDQPDGWWSPRIADVAVGGWRESGTPWVPPPEPAGCDLSNVTTVDLLAIPAGIYLLWGWNSYEETPTSPHWFAGRRSRVDFNGGTGWTEFHACRLSLPWTPPFSRAWTPLVA